VALAARRLAVRRTAVRRPAAEARAVTPLLRARAALAALAVALGVLAAVCVEELVLAGAGAALFFACPGAAVLLETAVAAPSATRAAFFACPGGDFVFALPAAARFACPGGGPLSAGRSASTGDATAMHSRAVTRRAGTRCKRELGDATVTNFLIGKRRIRREYVSFSPLSTRAAEFPHYGRFF
jgi:hypothetical protein